VESQGCLPARISAHRPFLVRDVRRAIAEFRGEVADLALRAAGKVIGETMTDDRQRRLVDQFLDEASPAAGPSGDRNG
jgi:hypothetical protein